VNNWAGEPARPDEGGASPDVRRLARALEQYANETAPLPPPGLDERIIRAVAAEPVPGSLAALAAALQAGSPHALPRAIVDFVRSIIELLRTGHAARPMRR
jgi:hypothetical protein